MRIVSQCGFQPYECQNPVHLLEKLTENLVLVDPPDPKTLFRGGTLIQEEKCILPGCEGIDEPTYVPINVGISIQVGITPDAFTIQQCLDYRFLGEVVQGQHCDICGEKGGMKRKEMFPQLERGDKWVLLISLNTHVFAPSGVEKDNHQIHAVNPQAEIVTPDLKINLTHMMQDAT